MQAFVSLGLIVGNWHASAWSQMELMLMPE
jgi:hypothetical protein